MEDQSSTSASGRKRAATVAAVLGIALFGVGAGFAVSGCGSDDNNNDVSNAINSVQGGLSTAQGALSTAQQKAGSVGTQAQSVQSQVQSVKSQISTATNSGGSGQYGY
jgi:hypothetical protein